MLWWGEEALEALEEVRKILTDPTELRRRWYPDDCEELAGFWEGQCVDSHEYTDTHSRTSNGIPVITGDASGDQGAAHFEGEL